MICGSAVPNQAWRTHSVFSVKKNCFTQLTDVSIKGLDSRFWLCVFVEYIYESEIGSERSSD